jgi:ribonucleoside-diphosphate reductase alpha chain
MARGVNGFSSGAVTWLDDLGRLTNLVIQGGSRRGAQMIMMADWHSDIIEFIISKMQNPKILRFILQNFQDERILSEAQRKLKFTPLSEIDQVMHEELSNSQNESLKAKSEQILADGGVYEVNDPEFLSGANISVAITKDFMDAVENKQTYALRFPDVDNYSKEEMKDYDEKWQDCGDVREWEKMGYAIKTYHTVEATELWKLINVCATYSAEPGIFFIDNANEMTNAQAYGQQVVATNPCGEQPLSPFSVCNLAAVNLAEFANKKTKKINYEALAETVRVGIRMQDNVIDATPYFLEENEKQALGERRVGLGVMGLHDLLIYCGLRYGSKEGNEEVDKIFETIATTAYETSIEIAEEKGSFSFLVGKDDEGTMELRNKFINTGFMKKMPEHIRQGVLKTGIRNSHLLTVAPK